MVPLSQDREREVLYHIAKVQEGLVLGCEKNRDSLANLKLKNAVDHGEIRSDIALIKANGVRLPMAIGSGSAGIMIALIEVIKMLLG